MYTRDYFFYKHVDKDGEKVLLVRFIIVDLNSYKKVRHNTFEIKMYLFF